MGLEAAYLTTIIKQIRPYYQNAEQGEKIILEHCGISGACGLIPAPGIDTVVMASSHIVMFGRLNKALGLSLSKDICRVLGKAACSLVAGNLAAVPIVFLAGVGGSLVKLIPGVGTAIGAVLTCGAYAACTYVVGIVYLKALAKATAKGPVTQESLTASFEEELSDKKQFAEILKEGKEATKGMRFSDFADQARRVKEEEPVE